MKCARERGETKEPKKKKKKGAKGIGSRPGENIRRKHTAVAPVVPKTRPLGETGPVGNKISREWGWNIGEFNPKQGDSSSFLQWALKRAGDHQ